MAKFTFTVNNRDAKPVENNNVKQREVKPKKVKVELTKHDAVEPVADYYLYVNENGEKCKYSGIVAKDLDGSYVGKIIKTHKVILDYHPKIEAVEHIDEYFSYIDNNDKERIFIGQPEFNLETNTYFGTVTEDILQDEIVEIFKEDK